MSQLGIVISTVYGASYKEVVQLSQVAEDKGWDAVFMSEAMNDALAGIHLPILVPNAVNEDFPSATRKILATFSA